MIDEHPSEPLKMRVEERIAANRQTLDKIDQQMRSELAETFPNRHHNLLCFLAVERRYYAGLIAELQSLL